MKEHNEFDELARRKLEEREFPFRQGHWLEMEKAIDAQNAGRRRWAGWWFLPAVLIMSIAGFWLLQPTASTDERTVVQEQPATPAGPITGDPIENSTHTMPVTEEFTSEPNASENTDMKAEEPVQRSAATTTRSTTTSSIASNSDQPNTSRSANQEEPPADDPVQLTTTQRSEDVFVDVPDEHLVQHDDGNNEEEPATMTESDPFDDGSSADEIAMPAYDPVVITDDHEQQIDTDTSSTGTATDATEDAIGNGAEITFNDPIGSTENDPDPSEPIDEGTEIPIEEEGNTAVIDGNNDQGPVENTPEGSMGDQEEFSPSTIAEEEQNENNEAEVPEVDRPDQSEGVATEATPDDHIPATQEDTVPEQATTPLDTLSSPELPTPATPPLVDPRAPFEIGIHAGIAFTNSTYGGADSEGWNRAVERERTYSGGLEIMRMGRNIGVGGGIHYMTFTERIRTNEVTETNTFSDHYYFLSPVDTTLLLITDSALVNGEMQYSGQSVNTTVMVLDEGYETITNTTRLREARNQVNSTTYLEFPLLLDLHLIQGRWNFGFRGGPTLGLLTFRRGAIPNVNEAGFIDLSDQEFRSVVFGYTARAYVRHRFNSAWSVGLEPMIRGHLSNGLEGDRLSRRPFALGGVISLNYRFH